MNTGLIVLFVMLGICLLIGLPMALLIGISCTVLLTINGYPSLGIIVQRAASGAKSFNTMAVLMSIFTGSLVVYGSTPRLMEFANMILRRIPDGLGATAFAACGLFGTASGSGVASVAAIGKIIGLEMLEQRYPRGLIVRLIAVGGTMICIIPPSIVVMVYTSSSGASVGDMFLAGFVLGFICIIALIGLNTFFAAKRRNEESVEKTDYTTKERLKVTGDALLPLLVPIFVLRGVFSGIRIATEASVVAVIYSFTLTMSMYQEPTLREFYRVVAESAVITDAIMLTISIAMPFGQIMSIQNMPALFVNWLLSITSSEFLIMAPVFPLLLLLGTFMETMCIIILVAPILLPTAQAFGMGVVHYGIPMLMALMVGSLIPPFSVNLFTAYRVLDVKYDEVFPDTLQVILTVATCALLTLAVPETTELLPVVLKQGEPCGYG